MQFWKKSFSGLHSAPYVWNGMQIAAKLIACDLEGHA
jgi:hypothetical protein